MKCHVLCWNSQWISITIFNKKKTQKYRSIGLRPIREPETHIFFVKMFNPRSANSQALSEGNNGIFPQATDFKEVIYMYTCIIKAFFQFESYFLTIIFSIKYFFFNYNIYIYVDCIISWHFSLLPPFVSLSLSLPGWWDVAWIFIISWIH